MNALKPIQQTSIFNKAINIQQIVMHLLHIITAVCYAGEEANFWRSVAVFKSQRSWLQGKTQVSK